MNTQDEQIKETPPNGSLASTVAFLAVGLGIGAAVSILLAPKSGEETRRWIAGKCLDAVDTANEKIRVSRGHVKEIMDRGQIQVSEAVAAGRVANSKPKQAGNGLDLKAD
jgi:gas vesicle protein